VVIDPDSIWGADGKKLVDRSKRRPANPSNINEDSYQGGRLKGRKKFGKIFDDEAKATIAEDAEAARKLAEATTEVEDAEEVSHLLNDENEDEQLGEALNLDDHAAVLSEIKILDAARKGGDAAADEALLNILQQEYARPGGARPQVRGALSALGYKKPGK
jgi:hypothetical protein